MHALLDSPDDEPGERSLDIGLDMQPLAAALALDAGDLSAARAWLGAHDRWLAWSGAVLGQAEGLLGWAAYHRKASNLPAARAHAATALAHAQEPRQPLILLTAHRLLGELDMADERHADASAHLLEALALAGACAAPYERALTLLSLAELRLVAGEYEQVGTNLAEASAILGPLRARPALQRADTLAVRLSASPRFPDVCAPDPMPRGLTPREVEVLRLVARGLSNTEVAARRGVAPRTINSHLTNIYAKLDVEGRPAAIRAALDYGLR